MIEGLLRSLRPQQWIKNSFLFAGAIFGRYAGAQVLPKHLVAVALAFCCFCLLSSAVYLFNDLLDREQDRAHPVKRSRPIASGQVPVPVAVLAIVVCLVGAGVLAWFVSFWPNASPVRQLFWVTALAYLGLNVCYSLLLKEIVLLDVLTIASGFVLRVVAGCVAVPVTISPWILVCTLLLALFMGLCKRRDELLLVGGDNVSTRLVLPHYSLELLNQMISQTTAAVIVAYMLYTFQPHGTHASSGFEMMLTVPFVIYGVWRYQYLSYRKEMGGSPEKAFSDVPFLVNLGLWVGVVIALAYSR